MSAYELSFIQLTTLGSRTVRIAATAGLIDDSAVSLWVQCDHRVWNPEAKTWDPETTAYAMTASQACELIEQMQRALKDRLNAADLVAERR